MSAQTIVEWITDPDTCFLVGAGCSKCAGKPLMAELTEQVEAVLPDNFRDLLNDLTPKYGRAATVEDLINHLIQFRKLLGSRKTRDDDEFTLEDIEEQIGSIQRAIVDLIGGDWQSNDVHEHFLDRLTKQKNSKTWDIFSLNYDTIFEATLENLKLPYTDGFRGADNAYFDHTLFGEVPSDRTFFRLYKLHGSVNWIRDDDGTVRRKPGGDTSKQPAVVYPAEQKYVQTQYGVYETLLGLFRERLRLVQDKPNNKLVVLGYSFGDEHINVAIEDSINTPGSNLTVYAFVGADSDTHAQERKFREIAERCDDRFNVLIGNHGFIGKGIEEEDHDDVLKLDTWKFESLVDLVIGGGL